MPTNNSLRNLLEQLNGVRKFHDQMEQDAAAVQGPPAPTGTRDALGVPGMVQKGNIDLNQRPIAYNDDGSYSTVRSAGSNIGGRETLYPTVADDGRVMSPDEAGQMAQRTGKNLGVFKDAASSDAYAQSLHEDQAGLYEAMARRGDPTTGPPSPRVGLDIGNVQVGRAPQGRVDVGMPTVERAPQGRVEVGTPTEIKPYETREQYGARNGAWPDDAVESSAVQPAEMLPDIALMGRGLKYGGKAAMEAVKALKTHIEGQAARKELASLLESSGLKAALKDFKPMSGPPASAAHTVPRGIPHAFPPEAAEAATGAIGAPVNDNGRELLRLIEALNKKPVQ